MEGSGHCRHDDSSTQVPLPWPLDGSRRHDSWARCMAGVTVGHRRHQPTSWPIKQAHTSRCLERRWISADPIRSSQTHELLIVSPHAQQNIKKYQHNIHQLYLQILLISKPLLFSIGSFHRCRCVLFFLAFLLCSTSSSSNTLCNSNTHTIICNYWSASTTTGY